MNTENYVVQSVIIMTMKLMNFVPQVVVFQSYLMFKIEDLQRLHVKSVSIQKSIKVQQVI